MEESSWRFVSNDPRLRGAQIDLVIVRNDNVIDLCEMKFTTQPFEMDEEEEMKVRNRYGRFIAETKTDKAVHLVLISANKVVRNAYSDEFQVIILGNDLFAE